MNAEDTRYLLNWLASRVDECGNVHPEHEHERQLIEPRLKLARELMHPAGSIEVCPGCSSLEIHAEQCACCGKPARHWDEAGAEHELATCEACYQLIRQLRAEAEALAATQRAAKTKKPAKPGKTSSKSKRKAA